MQAARSSAPDLTGTTLGDYRLSHHLGVGGMGEVWQAHKLSVHDASKQVAVKLLHESFVDNPMLRAMFFTEAKLAMQINNANTVQVFELSESETGRCYMIMEWVDGLNLRQLCTKLRGRGERLPLDLVTYIIGELLKALICIHDFIDQGEAKTIVHRDVTPENVMLSVWGGVKLMDFGIARLSSDESEELMTKGKLPYMSPEQLSGDPCSPGMDLFAVGALLHELLEGESFRSSIEPALLEEAVSEGFIPALKDPARVPPELAALREGLLAPELDARVPSAREAYIQLRLWPGCHDAQFDLERLVREFAPPGVARELDAASTIESISSLELVTWNDLEPSPRARPPRVPRPLLPAPPPALPFSPLPPVPLGPAPLTPSPPPPPHLASSRAPSPTPRRSRARLPLAAALFALTCAAATAALASKGFLPPLQPTEALEYELPETPRPEPRHWATWRHLPTPTPTPRPSSESEAASDEGKPAPATPRSVHISLGGGTAMRAHLRIQGRNYTIERGGSELRLRPGIYPTHFRWSPDTAWRYAGKLHVSAFRPNRVSIDAGGGLETRG